MAIIIQKCCVGAYGNANWKDQLTKYDSTTITYDTIGNILSDGTWTYTWEHGKQLAQMVKTSDTISFEYNEDGLRTKKTATSTGTTEYTLHGKNIVHMTRGNHTLHFYYDSQGKPGIVIYNGTAYGYRYNLQGDVVALVDGDGTKVVEYVYDAWGRQLSRTGTMAGTLGKVQPFRYRGYVYDEETGLYYLRSRYYKPGWNRFISADALVKGNLYEYCTNNPIRFEDIDGKIECDARSITPQYYEFLRLVYCYSIEHRDDPNVIPIDTFEENILKNSGSDCAYSIAKCLKFGMSYTGMTSMLSKGDAIAIISIEDAGGTGPHLLDYSILAMYDPTRDKPWHHGGILMTYPLVYEACSSHAFGKGNYSDQKWTHIFWHKGVKLSGDLLLEVERILYTVIDDEEEE